MRARSKQWQHSRQRDQRHHEDKVVSQPVVKRKPEQKFTKLEEKMRSITLQKAERATIPLS